MLQLLLHYNSHHPLPMALLPRVASWYNSATAARQQLSHPCSPKHIANSNLWYILYRIWLSYLPLPEFQSIPLKRQLFCTVLYWIASSACTPWLCDNKGSLQNSCSFLYNYTHNFLGQLLVFLPPKIKLVWETTMHFGNVLNLALLRRIKERKPQMRNVQSGVFHKLQQATLSASIVKDWEFWVLKSWHVWRALD